MELKKFVEMRVWRYIYFLICKVSKPLNPQLYYKGNN